MVIGGSGSISVYVFGGDTMSRLGGPKLLFPQLKIRVDRMPDVRSFPVIGAEMV